MTGSKNISLTKTEQALKELNSILSECSARLGEKKITAGNKEAEYQKKLEETQHKFDLLCQSSMDAAERINDLAAQIDKVLD